MIPKALNCPFCQGPAKKERIPGSWGYYPEKIRVLCGVCGIHTPWFHQSDDCSQEHLERAVELWNKRPEVNQPDRFSYDDLENGIYRAGFRAGVEAAGGTLI